MTIALGILGRDFVLIGADTEGSFGTTKFDDNKIDSAIYIADGGNRQTILCGAGNTQMIKGACSLVSRKVLKDARLNTDPEAVFDQAIERFYTSKVTPLLAANPSGEYDFSLLVAYRDRHRVALLASEATSCISALSYAVRGLGQLAAVPILARLIGPNPAVRLDQAIMAAAYAIYRAKESVQFVGKRTDIRYITRAGMHGTVDPSDLERIEQLLQRYESQLSVQMFRAATGFWASDRADREIRFLRRAFAEVLTRYGLPALPDLAGQRDQKRSKGAKSDAPPSLE